MKSTAHARITPPTEAAGIAAEQGPPLQVETPGRLDTSLRATWRQDLGAGLVVFLVALPLCLGVSLASGAPMLAGVITGIVGGLLVSRLSGSQLMVSGPAAGLTAIVFAAIAELGSYPAFLVAVVLAGLLQLGLAAARAGIIGYFLPSSVLRGMLAAIGLTLVIKQVPYLLGAGITGSDMEDSAGMLGGLARAVTGAHPTAVAVALLSLGILVLWPRVAPAALRRVLPAPLAVVLLAAAVALGAPLLAAGLALPAGAMVQLPTVQSLADLRAVLAFPDWSQLANPEIYQVAITLALVASLETLLSLEATDKLDPYKRSSPANRELLAQGTGNVVAGLLGGIPMTGVIVRSAANVAAGGRTWRASFFHGLCLVAAVLALPRALGFIPLAALAAILVHTGIKLASPAQFRHAWRIGPKYAIPFTLTVVAILATDLLVGIGFGLAVGAFFVLLDNYRNGYSFSLEESADHRHLRLTLAEEVTFLNKARINAALVSAAPGSHVTVDGRRTRALDQDVRELLDEFADSARAKGIRYRLIGVEPPAHRVGAH